EAAAATWFIEQEGGSSAAQAEAFEQWQRADPRHAAAYARFRRSAEMVSKWPLLDEPLVERSAKTPIRKTRWVYPALLAATGLAAVLTVAIGGWWLQTRSDPSAGRYVTSDG